MKDKTFKKSLTTQVKTQSGKKKNVVVVKKDKKKYSVPFKKKVVQQYLSGLKDAPAILREHGVNFTLLYSWLRWYQGYFMVKSNPYPILKTKATEDKARILELEEENQRILAQLRAALLRAEAMEHLVKLAKEHHGIELKKTFGKKLPNL